MESRRYTMSLSTAVLTVAIFAAPSVATAQVKQQGKADGGNATAIAAVKAALDKYKDPIAAVRDGYFSTVGCIDFPAGGSEHGSMEYKPGAMGVHFLNPALIGPKLDSTKPQVLLYEPVGDKLVLTGAEWFVPTAVSKTPPSVLGHQLMGPMEGHPPILPAELHHWDLHVWLYKDNPNGMYSPTNSAVKCPKGAYSFADAPPKMVKP
ncbi:MAG TPA: hypothetical protein VNS10_04095 [Gemmatimonadaceae bacterium]|jgi:hypothetical protein|nr:hypothetical protein [Gemmatimonadaceae bacterium]